LLEKWYAMRTLPPVVSVLYDPFPDPTATNNALIHAGIFQFVSP
jgi:hypothetical protein